MTKSIVSNRVADMKGSAIREIFKLLAQPGIISLAGGAPAPELFPAKELSEIAADILANQSRVALQYGITEGYEPLRNQIKERMRAAGTLFEGNDLIVTSGGQQVIDLTVKSMVSDGDHVVVEIPSFIGGLNALRSYNAVLHGVSLEEDGLNLDELEELAKTTPIRLIYCISTFQNPSGITMSLEKRKRLLSLAEQYDFYILEDNPYYELRFQGENIPSIKSMDTTGRVIYAGTYSKILSPGMRIGFAVAPTEILSKMIICKQVSDVHTTVLTQMIASEYMKRYDLEAHIQASCDLYRERCHAMLSALETYFPEGCTWTHPDGGIFLWVSLPEHIDTQELLARAVEKGVAFVPGNACAVDENAKSHELRLNYSTVSNEKITEGIRILADVIREKL